MIWVLGIRITFDFLAAPVIQSPKRAKVGERGLRVAMDDWAKNKELLPLLHAAMAKCQKQFPIKSTKTNFESWIEF